MAAKKKLAFEDAIAELEATVDKLERDEGITLDESVKLFTRGVELTRVCNEILEETEGRIVKLVEGDDVAGGADNAGGADAELFEEDYAQ